MGRTRTPTPVEAEPAQGVGALDRAFAILGAFLPGDTGGLTLAELAARTGLYKSTILRLAQSLAQHQFLQRIEDGRYQIGPAPLMLAAHYQRSLRMSDVLLPMMRELSHASGESVSFYVRRDSARVCLLRVDSRHNVRDHVLEGDILPLARGSGGRVLLAFSGAGGEPYETIRKQFYYVSLGERDPETGGISSPVFASGERLAGAMTLTGPRSRVDHTFVTRMRSSLLTAAARASRGLGADGSLLAKAARSVSGKRRAGSA